MDYQQPLQMQGIPQQAYMQNIAEQQRMAELLRQQEAELAQGAQLPAYQSYGGGGGGMGALGQGMMALGKANGMGVPAQQAPAPVVDASPLIMVGG